MHIKRLVIAGAVGTLIGGFALVPAHADDQLPDNGIVQVDGAMNDAGNGGYVVVEAEGGVPVNPLDHGYIGVTGDTDSGPTLKGSCTGETNTDADGNELQGADRYQDFDPTNPNPDTQADCTPAPS